MRGKTTCRKCGTTITIDFGNLTYAEARNHVAAMDQRPMECPGYHVELGGWRHLWKLDELLADTYSVEAEVL